MKPTQRSRSTIHRAADGTRMKLCPACRRLLAEWRFVPDKRQFHGVSSWCRECRRRARGVKSRQAKPRMAAKKTILRAVREILRKRG